MSLVAFPFVDDVDAVQNEVINILGIEWGFPFPITDVNIIKEAEKMEKHFSSCIPAQPSHMSNDVTIFCSLISFFAAPQDCNL